jgi:CHASE2 domain-containing sensor protein
VSKWRNKFSATWKLALIGAVVCAGVGLVLLGSNHTLINLGYDLIFVRWRTPATPQDVQIIYMDDKSFVELKQANRNYWDRNLHADLVRRLTADQARVVVFDIVFDDAGEPQANNNFADAMRQNGKVVLAARRIESDRGQIRSVSVQRAIPSLSEAAAAWGVAGIYRRQDEDSAARQYFVGDETRPSLIWAAARVAGAPIAKGSNAGQPATRINYYGPPLTLPHTSYTDVSAQPPGFFHNKCVFIGAHQKTLTPLEQTDVFSTPYGQGQDMPGVEVGATAFLNILRMDGITEVPLARQQWVVASAGLLLGFSLVLLRPLSAAAVAVIASIICVLVGLYSSRQNLWWAWPVIAFGQIPLALAWSIGGRYIRLKFEKDVLTRTLAEATRLFEATKLTAHKAASLVPDHDLVRLVGKGAYGEVWLARNAVGVFHAVKIVRRAAFPSDVPYEREFRGIQKFMPVSRSHPGFVHVLHVGRNDTERLFYCIMEAGDDQTTGQKIDPETYTPKSLASELKWRGRLAPEEALRVGLALSVALEHLHQHRLIHRDIKPGNIIYVDNQPKFADIGLVTDVAGEGRDVSFLGTQGYIPPEGPGSPSADVYALGKVLYEAAMGRDRELFPELPTAVYEAADDSLLRRLQKVIYKACESEVSERYASAAALHAALQEARHE